MNYRSRAAKTLAAIAVVILLIPSGCGYGTVSRTGYEYAKALYSLSNRQSADRVNAAQAQIDAAADSGELSAQEAEWLRNICEQCRNGNWKSAQSNARRMMTDQVKH